ncbi:MAG: NAD(P)/FAD-dependent oxidoreductase [Euryarchaeota archaeon]|nr:NAD(P)/FAD-dependent oxidoreductase [Euryarchaeota archaeon]
MPLYDVAISGGGPSGSYCAYRCAQAGLSTVLIERRVPPWTKVCAGGVLLRAASRLDFPLPSAIIEKEVRGLLVAGEGFRERFRFDRGLAYTVHRPNLDTHLLGMAERAGAELMLGDEVKVIHEGSDVELHLRSSTVRARCAVVAEGAGSGNAHRLLGPPPKDGMAMGLRSICPTIEGPEDEIEVFFIDSPTRGIRRPPMFPLMGWMFPYRGMANLGVGGHGYSKAQLMAGMDHVLRHTSVRVASAPGPPSAHPIPIIPRPKVATRRTMLIGDSAGLVSPLSGEGLSHGLASSILAAEAAIKLASGDKGAILAYEDAVASTIIRDIKAAAIISPVLHWLLGVVDTGAFFRAVGKEEEYIRAWTEMALGEETWQRLLMMTIPRFHRLFFRSLA